MTEPGREDTIAVIDDDSAMRLSCKKILSKVGYRVETFEDGAQGLEGVAGLRPALVLVDLKMPGISGMEVIGRVHGIDPQIIVVVITGYATVDTAVEALKRGAYDFLPKPFSPDELRLIVKRGLERRRLTLESLHHEVERALLQRRFVTFVSHQLQTPLVAIHQYLDVMRRLGDRQDARAQQQEWLERCLKRIEEMQALIRDWLTLAKVEGGRLASQQAKVDLQPIVAEALQRHQEVAARQGVSLQAHPSEKDCYVRGDSTSLSVLLDNLLANAIKYNKPGGSVSVSTEVEEGQIVVAVKDTGVGIRERHRPFLFDDFFRIPSGEGEKAAGTGLGLPICKKIVAEMGGSIDVESEVNVGSTFRVSLPPYRERAGEGGSRESPK